VFRFDAGSGVPIYRQLMQQVLRDVMLGRAQDAAGKTTALVRCGASALTGPAQQGAMA